MYHDDAIYVASGQSLASGSGLRIPSLPGDPPQIKYPIGLPLQISLVMLFVRFPDAVTVLAAIQALTALAAVLLSVLYLIHTGRITPRLGAVIYCASALNPQLIDFAPMIMAEMPATLLVALGFFVVEYVRRRDFSFLRTSLLGIMMVLPVMFRFQAITFPAAVFVYLVQTGKRRLAVLSLSIATLLFAPQLLFQLTNRREVPEHLSYYGGYLGHSYGTLQSAEAHAVSPLTKFIEAVHLQFETYFPFASSIQYDKLSLIEFQLLTKLLIPLITAIFIYGGIREMRRGSPVAWYCFLNAILLGFWPTRAEWRHIVPFLAFNYYLLFQGIRGAALKIRFNQPALRRLFQNARLTLAAIFCLYIAAGAVVAGITQSARYPRAFAKHWGVNGVKQIEEDFAASYDWIRHHTSEDETILSINDGLTYLHTGRKSTFPSRLEIWRFAENKLVDGSTILETAKNTKAAYLMVEPSSRSNSAATAQALDAVNFMMRADPPLLKHVFRSPHGLVNIFKIASSH